MSSVVVVGPAGLTIEEVVRMAEGTASPELSQEPAYRAFVAQGAEHLARRFAAGDVVYGVNTGFGDSCETAVPIEHALAMPVNLMRFHGCGTGRILDEVEAGAVVAVRLAALARGWSGVRVEVLERLCQLLQRGVLPRIPAEGSVGASGDLTPLSYVVAALVGEREVWPRMARSTASTAILPAKAGACAAPKRPSRR